MAQVVIPKNYSGSAGSSGGVASGNLFTQSVNITLGDGNLIALEQGLNYALSNTTVDVYDSGTKYITIDTTSTGFARHTRFLALDILGLPKFINRSSSGGNAGMLYIILRIKLLDGTYIELHKETISPGSTSNNTYGNTINKKYYINLLTRDVGTYLDVFGNDYYKAVVPNNWMYTVSTSSPTATTASVTIDVIRTERNALSIGGYMGIEKHYIWNSPTAAPGTSIGIDTSTILITVTYNEGEFRFLKLVLDNVPILINSSNLSIKPVYLKLRVFDASNGNYTDITLNTATIINEMSGDDPIYPSTSSAWADGTYWIDLKTKKIIDPRKALTSI